jgi:serine/threonine protein kinase
MNDSSDRDVAIFTEALELPAGERAAYLERECGSDADLRRRVEALLKSHESVGDFLEDSPSEAPMIARLGGSSGEKPGDRVGRYKLLQQIGEGGCGVVFMADQEVPVRRRVALKIIKPGMDTKSVIARFEAERQALALMDHPNIAKIFDAGATESGRPYFVMELVRGIKITQYCDQHSLRTEERLKLFVQVCQAIQHAHQKGIIHRDIKPSNILVTQSLEGTAQPMVIDFGIAKATTNQQLTDKTLFTAFEMLIGTPAYMSPEQAAFASLDVDTRSDIYSLGVLLYELLTGSTPFDTGELLKTGLDEIRRVIREQEPARPSTRLSKMTNADITAIAQNRRAEPPTLIQTVHGDLDWITMKALEKDRTRRYETANGLARDIERYLANEPVSARPPSKLYQLKKTVLRNKLLFASVGIIGLLLVVSLIIVSVSLAQERRAHREADAANAKSQQFGKFLQEMLNGVGPAVAHGRDTAIIDEILDATATNVSRELSNQPAVEADIRAVLGNIYDQIGHYGEAEEVNRAALAIRRKLYPGDNWEVSMSLHDLGGDLSAQERYPEAEQVDAEAYAMRRRLYGDENADTATSLNDLSGVYRDEGRLQQAKAMAQQALQVRRKLFTNDSADISDSLRNLAMIAGNEGDWTNAEALSRQVLAIRIKLLGPDHQDVAWALDDISWEVENQGRLAEAQEVEAEAFAIRQKWEKDDHPDIAKTLSTMGRNLADLGNVQEAHGVLKAVLGIQQRLFGDDNVDTLDTLNNLAHILNTEGNWAEAESYWREALSLWRKRAGNENVSVLMTLRGLGDALEGESKWPEAEAVWRESLASWRKRGGIEEKESMYTLRRLGLALEAEHKWPEAEAVHREALSISRKKKDGLEDPEALVDLQRVVRVLVAEKKFGGAEQLLNEVLTPDFIAKPASANLLIARLDLRGRQGRWQDAEPDAKLAVYLQPTDHYRYHTLAALLAITQNRPAYEQLCRGLLTKFANPNNPYVAERIAQDCLLLPQTGEDLEVLDKQADLAISLGNGTADLPYFQACKAMANYRLGRFPVAIEWGERAARGSIPYAQAKAYAILAMAHWQLGEKEAARTALDTGQALTPSIQTGQQGVDLGDSWVAWLMARVSLDEAAALIQPK